MHLEISALSRLLVLSSIMMTSGQPAPAAAPTEVVLPAGVRPVWDVAKAFRESTTTRERVCLNGLWRWQPADAKAQAVPASAWSFFKVPGAWPGITDYMQKDSQTVHAHPDWNNQRMGTLNAAWYQREITVPANWTGRRITFQAEYLNSYAAVFVDGRRSGEIIFPGGELDLTSVCRPGATHALSLLVVALPLKGVMLSYTDSASAREVKGSVARRGVCGDVFLVGAPPKTVIKDVQLETSVRHKSLKVEAAIEGLEADAKRTLRAQVRDGDQIIKTWSRTFQASELKDGWLTFTESWLPDKLWDLHTPQNQYTLEAALLDAQGKEVDAAWPVRFGFREFWIDGRDFYLNGSRIFLSALPFDNAQVSARLAGYAAARESFARLKSFGINFVYTHNYGCEPGAHLGFAEILRAADDAGILVSFSQPHFSHYDWQAAGADLTNGYARHAAFYVRAAHNHPSVVMYSMSHNSTGYSEDMNPDMIDGVRDARDAWALRNVKQARRAETIVQQLDPSRIIYHHASGNLGPMHVVNFYPNFAPIQELSDWFEHWATTGVKPVFTCEYGAPFTWDWTMYRGWYQGKREFGSAVVPWEFCLAEWNAQFLGDRAYRLSEAEKTNLRWEAKQFQAGKLWHRWDYPHQVGSTVFDERYPVFAAYLTDNWRAFRTWGVSATSPWEHGHFWKLREGVDKRRKDFPTDWENLQRPGFSADYEEQRYERMDLAFERSDWLATPAAEALIRNNRPLLAYLAGKPASFTSKDHNFRPGENLVKQIVVLNNSRQAVSCEGRWTLGLPRPISGARTVDVPTGQQALIPFGFDLPTNLAPGPYEFTITAEFSNGETQTDKFVVDVLGAAPNPSTRGKIAAFDPKGETSALLRQMGLAFQSVNADANLASYDLLVVGRAALTPGGAAPDIGRVRDGLKVIIFEQTAEALEKRLGFRVAEYGLRQVCPRVPDHPALDGLNAEHLRDWQGEATLTPPRLKYELSRQFNGVPAVQWCDLPVPRLWRCGNRGNVTSVLIEKPARGNFLPILDGGFSLQYSPLLEYREGDGLVVFCQVDVTGRTESDPAAENLARNLVRHVLNWKPTPSQPAFYTGSPAGKSYFASTGFSLGAFVGAKPLPGQLLILGHDGGQVPADAAMISAWLKNGGRMLAIGLDQSTADAVLPNKTVLKKAEHIAAWFEPPPMNSVMAGLSPAEVHNRDPRLLPLVESGARILGNGILAHSDNETVVVCQLVPWQFDPAKSMNLKRTHRRAACLVTRLAANLGASSATPLLERFASPVDSAKPEKRWLTGFYLDQPEEWDDPYRFFRW